jgi:hypothetical protein
MGDGCEKKGMTNICGYKLERIVEVGGEGGIKLRTSM